jgi:hypothetical protein
MEIFIPIFDIGSGQSVQFPLQGFSAGAPEGWSADGCFLLVSGRYLEGWSMYLVDIETGVSHPLLPDGSYLQVLFSPDGKWVAYESASYAEPGPWP